MTDNLLKAQEMYEKDPTLQANPLSICCHDINVTYNLDEDCCANIDIYNPYCDSARVEVQYFDPVTMSWVTKHVENPMTSYLNFKLCPEYFRATMEFRVTFFDMKRNVTYCEEYGLVEGVNVYTFDVELEQCCNCPEEEINSWFTFTALPDPECPDSCKVVLNLDIPDSISCFKYYVYAVPQLDIWDETPRLIENELISQFTACIGPGENIQAVLGLMIHPDDYTSANFCILEAVADCDTTGVIELPELNPPCEVSCPDSLWTLQVPLELTMTTCTNCKIKIHYVTRNNCNGKQELQILRMERIGPCWSCSDEDIYSESLKYTIATNAMYFEPKFAPDCDTTWRIGMGSCWTSWEYYQLRREWRITPLNPFGEWVIVTDTITVLEVCDSTACCFHEITVCRYTDGITISIDSTSSSFLTCSFSFSHDQWGLPVLCYPACHWLDDIAGFYNNDSFGKRNLDKSELEQSNYEFSSKVVNGILSIQINSDARKEAIIIIYDLLGNQIYSEEIFTQIGTSKHAIELNKFKTGFYVYAITIDDKLIKSDKFIYLK